MRRPLLRPWLVAVALAAAVVLGLALRSPAVAWRAQALAQRLGPRATVAQRVATYEPAVRARLAPALRRAGLAWPPRRLWLVAFKEERRLRVYAAGPDGAPRHLADYLIYAASGGPGPKLREGDGQVPEGLYRVSALNPNSAYHLALRVDYPNAEDRARAREDRRDHLGGDIMVHGGAASVGCLAMGDPAAEDLFVMAARAGARNVSVWIAPVDLRARPGWRPPAGLPAWMPARYERLRAALATLP